MTISECKRWKSYSVVALSSYLFKNNAKIYQNTFISKLSTHPIMDETQHS